MTPSKGKKLTWLLILQAWTMLWVVIGHAPLDPPSANSSTIDIAMHDIARALFQFAYSFHMPLFIMISGYLFYRTRIIKNWEYLKMVKEKWLRLGIPYLAFITFAIIIKILMPGDVNRALDMSPSGMVMNYIDPFNGALQEMWFVAAIFIYFLCYPIYQYIFRYKWILWSVGIISIGLFFIPIDSMTGVLALNRAVHYFCFFYAGMIISIYNGENLLKNPYIIALMIIGYVCVYIWPIAILRAFFGSFAFWGIAIQIDKTLTNNLFSSFRNYTYQIFLIGIFAQIFTKVLSRIIVFPGSYPVWWLICVLVGIYTPVIICKIPAIKNTRLTRYILGL